MANGVPTPFQVYATLPYQFPWLDQQPVVRIPIAGPEPFNTLVVVRGQIPVGAFDYATGKLNRYTYAIPTNFRLAGFDPRVRPPSQHSTSVTLNMMQTSDDNPFLVAADAADSGYFDDYGNWTVIVRVADQWDHVYAAASGYLSSWVMCFEPPIDPRLPHAGPGVVPRSARPNTYLVDARAIDRTEAGAKIASALGKARRRRARLKKSCPPQQG